MAAEYHVRIKGKVHGPFSGLQLKKLANKGQVTEEAEIGTSPNGPWFAATKVAGLFDGETSDADSKSDSKSGSSSSRSKAKPAARPAAKPARKERSGGKPTRKSGSSSPPRERSSARRKPKRKRAAVDANDVFDLDDSDDEVEFLDEDDDLFDDEDDDFEDDEEDRRSRRTSRGRSRRRGGGGTAWGTVRTALLLLAIGVCLYTAAYGMQALGEAMLYLSFASNKPPSQGTARLIELSIKGSVTISLVGNVLFVVGLSMAIFLPGDHGAKGLAIAGLSLFSVHVLTHFMNVFQPVFDGGGFGGLFRGRGLLFGGASGEGEAELWFLLTFGTHYAGLIVFSVLLSSVLEIKKAFREGQDCVNNIWLIGIYVGIILLVYAIVKSEMLADMGGSKAMMWLAILLRVGHLAVLGVYLGRLIPQSFHAKSTV